MDTIANFHYLIWSEQENVFQYQIQEKPTYQILALSFMTSQSWTITQPKQNSTIQN